MDLCQSLLNIKHTHCVLCFLSEERTRPGLPQFPLRSWSWQLLPSVPACRVPGCFAAYPCVSQRSKAALSTQVSPLFKKPHTLLLSQLPSFALLLPAFLLSAVPLCTQGCQTWPACAALSLQALQPCSWQDCCLSLVLTAYPGWFRLKQ